MLAAIITISFFKNKQGVLLLLKICQDIWALTASSEEKSGSSQYRLPKHCSLLLFLTEHNLIDVSSLSTSLRPGLHVEAALSSQSLFSRSQPQTRFLISWLCLLFYQSTEDMEQPIKYHHISSTPGKAIQETDCVYISHLWGGRLS